MGSAKLPVWQYVRPCVALHKTRDYHLGSAPSKAESLNTYHADPVPGLTYLGLTEAGVRLREGHMPGPWQTSGRTTSLARTDKILCRSILDKNQVYGLKLYLGGVQESGVLCVGPMGVIT